MTNIILLIFSILFFISGLIVLCWHYFKIYKEKFDFKNHFIYELLFIKKLKFYFIGILFLFLSILALIAVYINLVILKGLDIDQSLNIVYFICSIMGIFMIIPVIFISVFDLNNYKNHLFGVILFFLFNILLSLCLIILSSVNLYKKFEIKNVIIVIIASILLLSSLFMCLNPKLSNWYKLKEEVLQDGSKEYVRPRWFVLCYSEWSLFLIYFLNTFLFILANI